MKDRMHKRFEFFFPFFAVRLHFSGVFKVGCKMGNLMDVGDQKGILIKVVVDGDGVLF